LIFNWVYITAAISYLSINIKLFGLNSFSIISNIFALVWFHFFIFSMFYELPICSNLFIRLLTLLLFVMLIVIIAFSIFGFPSLLISAAFFFFMNPSILCSIWFNWVISPFFFNFDFYISESVFIILFK